MKEEWKTVPEWNLYEISNLGRLRSKDRTVRCGHRTYVKKGRILKPGKDKLGYYSFRLKQDGKVKSFKIHRLVALCFIPNPANKPCVNHIDNNPSNNCVDNLEWCTMKENTAWMMKQGRFDRTTEWLDNLHKSQERTYKAVKGTNIETGEALYFNRINGVKEMGFQPAHVSKCCNNKNGSSQHHGYIWEFISKEDYERSMVNSERQATTPQNITHRNLRTYFTRRVQNITTGECFDSVKEAAKAYDFQTSGMARAIKKGWKIGGCKWRYLSDSRDTAQMIDIRSDKE